MDLPNFFISQHGKVLVWLLLLSRLPLVPRFTSLFFHFEGVVFSSGPQIASVPSVLNGDLRVLNLRQEQRGGTRRATLDYGEARNKWYGSDLGECRSLPSRLRYLLSFLSSPII